MGLVYGGWAGASDDAGTAEVAIDDKIVGIVHQHGPGRDLPFDWSHQGLPPVLQHVLIGLGEAEASDDT